MGLGRAFQKFQEGDYQEAYELAQNATTNPVERRYLMAKCLWKLGQTGEARKLLDTIKGPLEDYIMTRYLDGAAKPYIEAAVPFKFGGFDDLDTYQKKVLAGNRMGLESSEYYEDFVDINTWKWKSAAKAREFEKIAGIDCSGYVQRVQQGMFKAAGVPYPIQGRTSTSGLSSPAVSTQINPGFKPPPPPDIKPGDMILLDYGHNRYGHSMIYRGRDAKGNILVTQMGGVPENGILAPEKVQFYKGTYRLKGMDKVRQKVLA
ncbi:MAG: tetratricopeptide repeat protein [Candidatus Riflebacteria bacterium]|nr:tetratricopeptide repeat protein [Candidatus Riflebacteria bacterium]